MGTYQLGARQIQLLTIEIKNSYLLTITQADKYEFGRFQTQDTLSIFLVVLLDHACVVRTE